jgi:hypothetical protein
MIGMAGSEVESRWRMASRRKAEAAAAVVVDQALARPRTAREALLQGLKLAMAVVVLAGLAAPGVVAVLDRTAERQAGAAADEARQAGARVEIGRASCRERV